MYPTFMKLISRLLMLSVLCMSLWTPAVQATMISSEQLAGSPSSEPDRERVRAFFDRADVQAQLQGRGISTESAKSRVDMMTDSEIATINGHLDNLPAGGDAFFGLIGLAVFIFIVLLITDILGLTKVFTFTRPIRH